MILRALAPMPAEILRVERALCGQNLKNPCPGMPAPATLAFLINVENEKFEIIFE